MEWGCEKHGGLDGLTKAEPGCTLCYAFLQGSRDALRQEVERWKHMHSVVSEKERLALLRNEGFQKRLSQVVNSKCSCGGMGPGACGCEWCQMYHFILGNSEKRLCEKCGESPCMCAANAHHAMTGD